MPGNGMDTRPRRRSTALGSWNLCGKDNENAYDDYHNSYYSFLDCDLVFFIITIFMEIDESDRILAFLFSVFCSAISFFAFYGLFMMLGAI